MQRLFPLLAGLWALGACWVATGNWTPGSRPDSTLHLHVSPRIVERASAEAGRTDPASAILWDYRSVDAFLAILACLGFVTAFAGALRGDERESRRVPGESEFILEDGVMAALTGGTLAFFLGAVPLLRGGAFLDPEFLPPGVGPEHLRAAGAWGLEAAALLACLAVAAVVFRFLRRGRRR